VGTLFTMQGKQQHNLNQVEAGDIVVTSKLQAVKTGDTLCDKSDPIQYEAIEYPEPMLEMAASAAKKGDEDKVFSAIAKQQEEDPTILVDKNSETRQTLLRGIGEVHLEILAEKLQRKFGVQLKLDKPRVAYRETIRKTVKVQGKHKKQSGGHGQYGDVWLEISPQPAGQGNEFTETIFGGSVPRQYIPAVEKGTAETLAQGILAGYPVVDVKVNLYDGSYHAVDSSEAAFKTATALALKKGVMEASPVLLEPIDNIKVTAPEYYMGDVMGRLNSKRAHIMGVDSKGHDMSVIQATIPVAELYKFATDLRSLTQGRGSYSLEFSHYEPMPEKAAEAIVAEARAEKN
jgi:elongation factor G